MDNEEIRQNTRDIAILTNTVTRVVTMQENAEKRHDSDVAMWREAFGTIKELNDKVGSTLSMRQELTQVIADVRAAGHDAKTAISALGGIELLNEKINNTKTDYTEKLTDIKTDAAKVESRVSSIEKRNDKIDGGVTVVEKFSGWMWALLAAVATGVLSNWSEIQHLLNHSTRVIGGE